MRRFLLATTLAVVSAVAVNRTAHAYRRSIRRARSATRGRSRTIESPFGRLEYADVGSGPTILAIHGSGGGFDQGLAVAGALADEGFRVIAPSRFGYLRSDMPDHATPEMQADALAYLMGRLGLADAVVVGASAGALSATQLALRHPTRCRGVVLAVPAMYAPDRKPGTNAALNPAVWWIVRTVLGSDFLFWAAITLAPDFMTRMLLATEAQRIHEAPESERKRARHVLFHALPVSERHQGLLMDARTAGDPPPYPLEKIGCPVLAISVRDDLYGTAKSAAHVAARAPDARLVLYDEGGHLWIGHNAEALKQVADFARSLTPTTAPAPPLPESDSP